MVDSEFEAEFGFPADYPSACPPQFQFFVAGKPVQFNMSRSLQDQYDALLRQVKQAWQPGCVAINAMVNVMKAFRVPQMVAREQTPPFVLE